MTAENKQDTSLSSSIKGLLQQHIDTTRPVVNMEFVSKGLQKSIYELASDEGITLQELVERNPTEAILAAEAYMAEWQKFLTIAASTGCVTVLDDNGNDEVVLISRNQTKMIELKLKDAKDQLSQVQEYANTVAISGDKRKDILQRAMYNRALKGDTRLAIYLHDRVDGRPMETKHAELSYDNAYNIWAIIKTLFDKQLEVLNSGSGTRMLCCTRRAGKSHLLSAICLIECLRKPRVKCIYIGETMELTENIVNKAMNDLIDTCNLKDGRGRRLNWKKLDNGSEIMIRGLSNTKDPDQIRGQGAKVIVIDEFYHLKSELLEYMIREVLEPMQLDYADDYMFICAGTPPPIKGTFGQHAWENWDVPHFEWSWRDNPHPTSLEARESYIEKILEEKGLTWDSPFAQREYLGRWVYDDDLLLYPEYHTYDPRAKLPDINPSRVILGIDYGVGDNDTIWGAVWDDDQRKGYQFWEDKFNRLDLMGTQMTQLDFLCKQVKMAWLHALDYFPHLSPREANKRILWSADDNDQHLTDHLNMHIRIELEDGSELKLNIQNAHKTDKSIMYEKIQALLRKGDLLLIQGSKTVEEASKTVIKRSPSGGVLREVNYAVYHPDLLPAMRYALWDVIGYSEV